jgi:O-antigen/teichoic acid export membrane protein
MLKKLNEDGFLTGSIIFFIGSMIVNGFNYLYQIIMGRMLGPEQYGVLGSLFALIYLVVIASTAFTTVTSKYTAQFAAKKQFGKIHYLISHSVRKIALFGLIPLGFSLFLSSHVANFLKIPSTLPVIIVFIIGYLSLIIPLFTGALNGLQRFKKQNISGIATTSLKLLLGITFVALGFGVTGAIIGIIAANIVGIIISFLLLSDIFKTKKKEINKKQVYGFVIPTTISMLILTAFISLDIIMVKHFFPPITAGMYAALANLGKIIWFGSSFFAMVMFPKISAAHTNTKNTSKLLQKTLIFAGLTAGSGIIAYFLIPTFLLNLLYGNAYIGAAKYLGWMGIALGLFSLNHIMNQYNLAIGRTKHLWILAIALLIEIIAILFFHNSLFEIIKIIVFINILTFQSFIIYNRNELFEK